MNRIPKQELKKVIDAQFTYERRKYIFWAFNTTYLGISLFQIYSDVNIEGGDNPLLCIDTAILDPQLECPTTLYRLLISLIIVHLVQILTGIIGYFGIDQKSRKINKSYIILLLATYLSDVIISFILCCQFNLLSTTPFKNTRNEFLMLLILFPILQGFVCYFSLNQFKKATMENHTMQHTKEDMLDKHPEIAHDVVKLFL